MKEQHYEFIIPKYGALSADDAMTELERIRGKYGILLPEDIIEESKDTDSVLHGVFTWDNEVAAIEWRKEQARCLIRNIRVVVTNKEVKTVVRAYVNVRSSPGEFRSYQPTMEIINNDEAYKDLLEQAKGEMNDFVSKYAQIEELNPVKAEMLKAINNV